MIAEITPECLDEAISLVNRVFEEFVAVDYSEVGRKTFAYIIHKRDDMAKALACGEKKLWGFFDGEKIIGVIGIRNGSHIALLFVDKAFQHQGIAKKLFMTAVDYAKNNSAAEKITFNSSPYAVPVYEKLGFSKTSESLEKDGIIFTPMEFWI